MKNTEYIPIPVDKARQLAEEHQKSIVIISAWDPVHELLHTTTYGVSPQDKAAAARGGELTAAALEANLDKSNMFQDYRLEQAQKLLAALQSALAIVREARKLWDEDKDTAVGKMLIYLGDPACRGYREDMDQIHETVKEALTFLEPRP